MRFTQTLLLTRMPEEGLVRLSISTSEHRVDEITVEEHELKRVVESWMNRSPQYQGGLVLQGKFKNNHFSLSVQNGAHTRTIYRLEESGVMAMVGKYLAETGGE